MKKVWEGAEELRGLLVPIESVTLHPRNPRRGQVALIAESLARFGQVRPILANAQTGEIVAGNHTRLAAQELGWTHIAVIQEKFETEDEARAYLLADNRLPELGDYDREQLLVLLGEVESEDAWGGTGYGPDDLEDLRAMNDSIPETARVAFEGDFAMTPEALAERAAQLAGGRAFDEVPLLFTTAAHAQFESDLKVLRKEYGNPDGGATELVCRAVAEEATGGV